MCKLYAAFAEYILFINVLQSYAHLLSNKPYWVQWSLLSEFKIAHHDIYIALKPAYWQGLTSHKIGRLTNIFKEHNNLAIHLTFQ